MHKTALIGIICLLFSNSFAQTNSNDKFANTVEQSLMLFYQEYANSSNLEETRIAFESTGDVSPQFSDDHYCRQINAIAAKTPMPFLCNQASIDIIKTFAKTRRNFTRVVMGRGALYFDLFEEKLAEYNLPIELKYLAVIESGLRPQVKSRAGALGLWQFMYRTGLYFELTENSYIDERMDPEKSTVAACKYLKQLYGIYGDWFVALAAYNAGPGNVNKAIRRSGGKTNYWELRPFLPKETQGYVPNFIAATYMITYHKELNIVPVPAKVHNAQLDTMCLKQGVYMQDIAQLLKWDLEEIKALNPVYKTQYIPQTNPPQCITGPLDVIGKLVSMEKELYLSKRTDEIVQQNPKSGNTEYVDLDKDPLVATTSSVGSVFHVVKKPETLEAIAEAYKVSVNDLVAWNNLGTTSIYEGQRILINGHTVPISINVEASKEKEVVKKYYVVRRGDTFGVIASKNDMTISELKKLNPRVNVSRLDVGQRLRIR